MNPFTVILLLITFSQYNALTIIKSATITPNTSNLHDNGAKVTELNLFTITPTKWTLHANTCKGFHLQLTLNRSLWAFHPTESTTLKIEVNANVHTSTDSQLMVAFSQPTSNKYFTTRIYIDDTDDHNIYPPCDYIPPYNQTYQPANIVNVVNIYNPIFDLPQYYKASDGWSTYLYNPTLSKTQRTVYSPLTFILFNNPYDKYMLFTYTNPNVIDRSCGYQQMDPNKGMDIYFASNGLDSVVDISSFIITHIYATTDAPTIDPTTIPTIDPTTIPTLNPTLNPTEQPTINPLTAEPTTKVPTNKPTVNPTANPTANPNKLSSTNAVLGPTAISKTPSFSPINNASNSSSEQVNDYTSTAILPHGNIPNSGDTANNMQYMITIASVCSVLILILIIIVLVIMITWKKRKMNAIKNQRTLSDVQQDTNSQNVITEMVVTTTSNDVDGNEDDVDLYDEVQSIDTVGATATGSDGNSLINAKHISVDEDDDNNMDIEGMYNAAKPTTTGGYISDDDESDEESEIITKRTADIVKSNREHIDENINCVEDEVKDWLNEIVELPQYYDIFVRNGLDSLKLIQKLNDNQELIDLGIQLKGHRIIILKHIKQLTNEGDSV